MRKRSKPAKTLGSPAASAETDSESGTEGGDARKDLFALDAMLKRGLISEEEYRRRRENIAGPDA